MIVAPMCVWFIDVHKMPEGYKPEFPIPFWMFYPGIQLS